MNCPGKTPKGRLMMPVVYLGSHDLMVECMGNLQVVKP